MSLPNLSNLLRNPLPRNRLRRTEERPEHQSGLYCLDRPDEVPEECRSRVLLWRGVLPAKDGEFEELSRFMMGVRQDTCMGCDVPRKQCTFGPVKYKTYEHITPEMCVWPKLVTRVLEATRQIAARMDVPDPEGYTGVHVNYYADENSSVSMHADDEEQLVVGALIFSYTYIENDDNSLARDFKIAVKSEHRNGDVVKGLAKRQATVAEIRLESGDLLVMLGEMQTYFNHGVDKVRGARVAPRLNLTVRKFVPKEPASASAPEGPSSDNRVGLKRSREDDVSERDP